MSIISVTCALIIRDGRVLAAQRSAAMDLSGKWEFPGGKIEPDEDPGECLAREILEELSIEVIVGEALDPSDFAYPGKTIRLLPFTAVWKSGEISLLEHSQVIWLHRESLFSVDWAAADVPIVHYLYENWVKLVDSIEP